VSDPPYWRPRSEPPTLERLGGERRLLLTAGDRTAVVRPVLADGRLLLLAPPDPELSARLSEDPAVTLTPCDSRGGPRPVRPFDAADPVGSSRPAEPVAAVARPSPQDARTALVRYATRHRLAAGATSGVATVRGLLGSPAPPPLVLEARLAGS
jgi:hypothetical protein